MARTWEDKENAGGLSRSLKNRSSNVSIYGWESFPRKGNPKNIKKQWPFGQTMLVLVNLPF